MIKINGEELTILYKYLMFSLTNPLMQTGSALWKDPHFIDIFHVLTSFNKSFTQPGNALWKDSLFIALFHVLTPFIIYLIYNVSK